MKLIHTADWHIGQSFYGYSREEEHRAFFDWLRNVARKEQADALLIAGDVFDTPNPPAVAQGMFYGFLREITKENPHLQIIIVSGNHDSAARLEAPLPLLESMNVSVKGTVCRNEAGIDYSALLVPVRDKNGTIRLWCMAVPYLRQGDYPPSESYIQGVKNMYEAVFQEAVKRCEPGQRIVAMGHLQATGSEISEDDQSERTVIGGLECVSPDAFAPEIAYTALGHLHKSQRVSKRENVRYAGTPLPMSFAEKNYKHGVEIVELNETGEAVVRREIFAAPVSLQSVPDKAQPIDVVLQEIERIDPLSESYIEVQVLVEGPEPTLNYRIQEALEGKRVRLTRTLRKTDAPGGASEKRILSYDELRKVSPVTIAKEAFYRKYGSDMPEELTDLLNEAIGETEI